MIPLFFFDLLTPIDILFNFYFSVTKLKNTLDKSLGILGKLFIYKLTN
jgi:hypothetical protein